MEENVELERAVELATAGLPRLGSEDVPLETAPGRTLARSLSAAYDQPPFPAASVDGYALRTADLSGARANHPVRLAVVGRVPPGREAVLSLGRGQAARVSAGSMLPPGCDGGAPLDATDGGMESVAVAREFFPFDNYLRQGAVRRAGDPLLPEGALLCPAALGLLASDGRDLVPVRIRPKVSLVVAGDELVPPGSLCPPGKYFDGTLAALRAWVEQLGGETALSVRVPDDAGALSAALEGAAARSDLVVTTGAVGRKGQGAVFNALDALGLSPLFRQVRMRPGSASAGARAGTVPILALPGGYTAAMTAFTLLARPVLSELTGDSGLLPVQSTAVLSAPYPKASPVRRFLWGVCRDGSVSLSRQGAVPGCNCLAVIPTGSGPLVQGTRLKVLLL